MKNKLMGILICLSMIVCLFPVRVSAAEPTTTVVLGDELNADVATNLTSATDLDVAGRSLTLVASDVASNANYDAIANAEGIVLTVGAAEVEAALKAGTTVNTAAFDTQYESLIKQIREMNPTAILVVGELVAPADASAELTAALAAVNGVITKYESTYFYDVVETGAITLDGTTGDIALADATDYLKYINAEFAESYPSSFKVTFEGDDQYLDFGEYYEHQTVKKTFTVTNNSAYATVVMPVLEGVTITATNASKNAFGAYTIGAGASITFEATGPKASLGSMIEIKALGNEGVSYGANAVVNQSTKITLLPGFEGGKTLEFYIGQGQVKADWFTAELKAAAEELTKARPGYKLNAYYVPVEEDGVKVADISKGVVFLNNLTPRQFVAADNTWNTDTAELTFIANWVVEEYDITISYVDPKTGLEEIYVDGTNMNDILGDLGDGISYNPVTNTLTIEGDQSAYSIETEMESLTIKGVNGKIASIDSLYKLVVTGTLNSEYVAAEYEITIDKDGALVAEKVYSYGTVNVDGSLTGNADMESAVEVDALNVTGNVTINANNQIGIAARILKIAAAGKVSVDNASKAVRLDGDVVDKDDQPSFTIENGGQFVTTNTDTAILVNAYTDDKKVVLDKDKVIVLPNGYLAADEEVKMVVDTYTFGAYEFNIARYTLGKVGTSVTTSFYENTLMVGGSLGNVALPQGTAATTPSTPDASTPGAGSTTIPNVSTGDDIMVWSGLLVVSLASLGLCVRSFAKEN